MLFNSYAFLLIYLPTVLTLFFAFSKLHLVKAAKFWLFISSLFFYAYWDVRYLPLLLLSIITNYYCGSKIISTNDTKHKKLFLWVGIVFNLSLLFYFKYFNFFLSHFVSSNRLIEMILPLGISFFTFTQLAYLVDAYKNKAEKCDPLSYGLFVTIFPHLIAGPILHHKDMIKQFNNLRMYLISWPNISKGTFLFIVGLFKKVVIADSLAALAKPIFDTMVDPVPLIQAWFGALTYTLQLYFDFSGYSDMAVGLGLMFSLHLPINFNSPYQADSIIDFWRRWHITLSNFLRDYLYISLGGNRNGKLGKLRNLLITMLLGGLWHGAGWTYILWGACHGMFLCINHLWRDMKLSMPNWLARMTTLLAVICAWVIFRSPTVEQAVNILKGMAGLNGIVLPINYETKLAFLKSYGISFAHIVESKFRLTDIFFIISLMVAVIMIPNSNTWMNRFYKRPILWGVTCALLFCASFINLDEIAEFLYYQF